MAVINKLKQNVGTPNFFVNDVDQSQERQARGTYTPAQKAVGSTGSGNGQKALEKQQTTQYTAQYAQPRQQAPSYTVNAGNQPYVDQLNALYDQIMGRKPFQYDLNGDLLYKQMADRYAQMGQMAMRDTMGTAAGLTGGYGNSYAQQVGNQAYQQYMTALNDQVPSLYEQALQAYLAEGDQLMQQYELAAAHPAVVNSIKPQTYTVQQKVQSDAQAAKAGTAAPVTYQYAGKQATQQVPVYNYEDYLKELYGLK